jgi:hypothetical protein
VAEQVPESPGAGTPAPVATSRTAPAPNQQRPLEFMTGGWKERYG